MQKQVLLAILIVALGFGSTVMADRRPGGPPPDGPKESELLPPPAVSFWEGRPIYRLNEQDVKPPEIVSAPDPLPLHDFSAGTVVLWCVVGTDGKAHMIKVAKRLNMEAEMKAMSNLRSWKFKPGKLKQDDIDVLMTVEIVWH
jgi:hypothetical protein